MKNPFEQNWFDRAISAIDPIRGMRRVEARAMTQLREEMGASLNIDNAKNAPGSSSHVRDSSEKPLAHERWWNPGIGDAVADTLDELDSDRARSRELYRTNSIAAGAINTTVSRSVGTGLALVPIPHAKTLGWSDGQVEDWVAEAQKEFSFWSDSTDCDLAGKLNFYDKQSQTQRNTLLSGDVFTLLPERPATSYMPYKLRLQTIEADRVGNPEGGPDTDTVAGGIKVDPETGEALSCFIYKRHPGSSVLTSAAGTDIYAGDWMDFRGSATRRHRVLHHYDQIRPEQPRGTPFLTPVIDLIRSLGRYTEAEVKAAIVSAFFTVFVEQPVGAAGSPLTNLNQNQIRAANRNITLGAGMVVGLRPGEKVEFADPTRPNTGYDAFVISVMRSIGMALGIPYELLVKKFDASFSASKAALLDAWIFIRGQRMWLSRSFCNPIYYTWLAEAVSIGRIKAPGFFNDPITRWAYSQCLWFGDSMGSINLKDEVEAAIKAMDAGILTAERAEWEIYGTDSRQTWATKVRERKRMGELFPTKQVAGQPNNAPAGVPAPAPAAA